LIFGLALANSGRRKAIPLFLIAGAIGQSSLLNTFCHIHTPVLISVSRALIGLFLGGIIGSVVFLVIQKCVKPDTEPALVAE